MIRPIKPDGEFIGSFIIASPFLGDLEFARSVILITNHSHDTKANSPNKGYSGFKINHTQNKISPTNPVYTGGRIGKKIAHLLHSPDIKWEKTRDITSELCVTNVEKSGIDLQYDLMPENYLLIYGCTVWMPGQLEDEIRSGVWLPTSGDASLIFEVPAINRWYQAYNRISTTPECISMDSARC
jgi:putative transcriptional regulator